MKNIDNDFSLDNYNEIVKAIKRSHPTLSFRDVWLNGEKFLDLDKFVIMRHDIEFSLQSAEQIARIDWQNDIRSTFFLLQTSEYNCFEEEGAATIKRIIGMGHDIGLHYDAGLFQRMGVDPEKTARSQIDLFETFFSTKVYAMSSHLPSLSGKTFSVSGVIDTYDPKFMVWCKYLSDSSHNWREGCVVKNLEKHNRIHLLMHEFWSEEGLSFEALQFSNAVKHFEQQLSRVRQHINRYKSNQLSRAERDLEFMKRYHDDQQV